MKNAALFEGNLYVVIVHSPDTKTKIERAAALLCCCLLHAEPETLHAALVLIDEGPAVGGGILGRGEEHALVTPRLFLFAYAARLGLGSGGCGGGSCGRGDGRRGQ